MFLIGATGCLGQQDSVEPAVSGDWTSAAPVVAIIDSGVNPYHAAFAVGSPSAMAWIGNLGIPSVPVRLAQEGSYDNRVQQDESFWETTERGQVYAFEGTRLAAVSFSQRTEPFVLDTNGHGTAVASLVAREASDAAIVMIQVDGAFCATRGDTECLLDPTIAEAMQWAAEQDWIDVVSVSIAIPANAPDDPRIHPEMKAYLDATRQAHDRGKVIVNGAGNQPVPPLTDYINGPPWIVAVGGFEGEARGEATLASKGVDVVANFSEQVALKDSVDGYEQNEGTSLATPIVAGTLAQALALNWRNGDVALAAEPSTVVRQRLRDALNVSAESVSATEWRPADPTNTSRPPLRSLPVLLPVGQIGWGYVHGGLAGKIAETLAGSAEVPAEKQQVKAYQEAWQDIRESYWGTASQGDWCSLPCLGVEPAIASLG